MKAKICLVLNSDPLFLCVFQACTGNEHIEECIAILEQYNWNLMVGRLLDSGLCGDKDPNPKGKKHSCTGQSWDAC